MTTPVWKQKAVQAEVLYLANLLAAPGLAFLLLCALWWAHRDAAELERCHIESAFRGSILAGILIICVLLSMFFWGEPGNPYFWVTVVLYFTTVHTTLVLVGVVGLANALANKPFYFPGMGVRRDG